MAAAISRIRSGGKRLWMAMLAVTAIAVAGPTRIEAGMITLTGTSYVEDFNDLGSGLPSGVTVRTGASNSGLGSGVTFDSDHTNWGNTAGSFNNYASSTGLLSNAAAAQQAASTNRLLGIRQTGDFGDPGAAFTFAFENTSGFHNFTLNFESHILSDQARSTEWTVRWASGENPNSFTSLGTFTQDVFGSENRSFSLGSGFDDSSEIKWIQIAALSPSTGTGSRDSFGIDNFSLNYSPVPEPTSLMLVAVAGAAGFAGYRRQRRNAAAVGT